MTVSLNRRQEVVDNNTGCANCQAKLTLATSSYIKKKKIVVCRDFICAAGMSNKARRKRILEKRQECYFCHCDLELHTSHYIRALDTICCRHCLDRYSSTEGNGKSIKWSGWKTYRQELWDENPCCNYCGKYMDFHKATLDHVNPRSKGGSNAKTNLVLACFPCNNQKSDMTLEAYMKFLKRGYFGHFICFILDFLIKCLVKARKKI